MSRAFTSAEKIFAHNPAQFNCTIGMVEEEEETLAFLCLNSSRKIGEHGEEARVARPHAHKDRSRECIEVGCGIPHRTLTNSVSAQCARSR